MRRMLDAMSPPAPVSPNPVGPNPVSPGSVSPGSVSPGSVSPVPPRPPLARRARTQLEGFLVLRRNPIEVYGALAYERLAIAGSFLRREQILVSDPDAIRHVLVGNHENYLRTVPTRRVLQPILGNGLLLAEGDAWRHQRRTIAPALAPRTMPILARHVAHGCDESEAALDRTLHRPVELLPHLQGVALAIAGRSMFSIETGAFAARLRSLLTRYAEHYAKLGLFDILLPEGRQSPLDRGRARFRPEWSRFLDGIIAERLDHAPPDGAPRDLFDLLASATDPETGARFSRAHLRDEIATLILAGHETTAVTLFWSLYLAALYPEQQERLAAEARAADLSAAGALASIPSLTAVRAHIDETMRLYPPVYLIVRMARAADTVAGHAIGPNTVVSMSPWVIHRHHKLWDAPDAFRPDRFAPGAPPPIKYSYLPFGAGPRVCVGSQFALTEAVIILARFLSRYRVTFSGSGEVLPVGRVTTQPDRPVRFLLAPR